MISYTSQLLHGLILAPILAPSKKVPDLILSYPSPQQKSVRLDPILAPSKKVSDLILSQPLAKIISLDPILAPSKNSPDLILSQPLAKKWTQTVATILDPSKFRRPILKKQDRMIGRYQSYSYVLVCQSLRYQPLSYALAVCPKNTDARISQALSYPSP